MKAVTTGLDRLLLEGPSVAGLAAGARLGFIAHPATIDREACHGVDRLRERRDMRLVRLFGPEHGVRGDAQDMEAVAETEDSATGLQVVSLYGDSPDSLRPRPEHLSGLDAIFYDLQDVGSRYYTFVYTLSYAMEAARDAGIPVVVLDRPNPVGGLLVEGPVLEPAFRSFVGRYSIPVRHGMTTAELALLFNEAFDIGADLRVIEMGGWRRGMSFHDTRLPWVAPSPNMPTVDTALVYPGGCLVEGTNLSEGRGTTRPFELVGAPWLDSTALATALRSDGLAGALFRATPFRPMFQKFAGEACYGVQVHVEDRQVFRPFLTYVALLIHARKLAGSSFDWRRQTYEFESDRLAIDLLLGRAGLRQAIEAGADPRELEASWSRELEAFLDLRRRFLLYEV